MRAARFLRAQARYFALLAFAATIVLCRAPIFECLRSLSRGVGFAALFTTTPESLTLLQVYLAVINHLALSYIIFLIYDLYHTTQPSQKTAPQPQLYSCVRGPLQPPVIVPQWQAVCR